MVEPGAKLPSGWAEVTVAQVGSIRLGRARSPSKQSGRLSTKYIRAANITDHGLDLENVLQMDFTPEERIVFGLRANDIVLADSSGSPVQVGRSAIWNDEITDCCYQNHVIRFRPHAMHPRFALLVFRHFAVSGIFASVARGMGILHLGASRFAGLRFFLPPWHEQGRIAVEAERRLTELQAAERSLRSALQRMSEQRSVILASVVAGQLAEADSDVTKPEVPLPTNPNLSSANNKSGLLPVSADEINKIAVPSNAILASPILPTGWKSVLVRDVGDLKLGRQRSPDKQTGRYSTQYIRAANVTRKGLDFSEVFQMDFTPVEREVFALEGGDIVLAEASGSATQVGRAAIWEDQIAGCCFQNTLIRFRPRSVIPQYALLVFHHFADSGQFAQVARGVGIQHLGLSRFAGMAFPLPPLEEQYQIAAEARRRLDASDVLENAVRSSLERLTVMEAEVIAAAVEGNLVAQDATDEPASELLKRLGDVPPDVPRTDASLRPRREGTMTIDRESGAHPTIDIADLVEIVRDAGQSLSLPELFSLTGCDRDSLDDIEQFYLALRDQIGVTIRTAGTETENAFVEVIPDAAR